MPYIYNNIYMLPAELSASGCESSNRSRSVGGGGGIRSG